MGFSTSVISNFLSALVTRCHFQQADEVAVPVSCSLPGLGDAEGVDGIKFRQRLDAADFFKLQSTVTVKLISR